MDKVKQETIKNMTDSELEQTIRKLKEELYTLRVELKGGRVEKPHRISLAKKNIARCYTYIRERKSGSK